MERIADVLRLKTPQFNTISSDRNILDALHQMRCEQIDFLIVLDDDERFIGILTDHDIAEKLFRFRDLESATVRDFMSTNLPVSSSNDSLEYCMQLMERYNVSYLAIYDGFEFFGVVSMNDLMKQALSKRKDTFTEQAEELYPWSY